MNTCIILLDENYFLISQHTTLLDVITEWGMQHTGHDASAALWKGTQSKLIMQGYGLTSHDVLAIQRCTVVTAITARTALLFQCC
jgi:hypothetical protein